jgi:hypothetical protein
MPRDVPADVGSLRDKPTALVAEINETRYLNFSFITHKEYSTVQSEKQVGEYCVILVM